MSSRAWRGMSPLEKFWTGAFMGVMIFGLAVVFGGAALFTAIAIDNTIVHWSDDE